VLGFKPLVPSRICLSCKGCCRFINKNTVWQPHLTAEERLVFKNKGYFEKDFNKKLVEAQRRGKLFYCQFFSSPQNSCRIYRFRPFECRLYPLVLTVDKGVIMLAAHLACPFILSNLNTKEFKRYVEYLRKYFFKNETRKFIKANPAIAQNYKNYKKELIFLFSIS